MAENAPSWMRRDEVGAVEDVERVEDVPGAAHEAEHLGDVHGVARPGVGEQFAELRTLQRVEAAAGAGLSLEVDQVLVPCLVREVLTVGRLLVGRHPLVDQVGHAAPRCGGRIRPWLSANPVISRHRISWDPRRRRTSKGPGSSDPRRRTCRHSFVCHHSGPRSQTLSGGKCRQPASGTASKNGPSGSCSLESRLRLRADEAWLLTIEAVAMR